MGQKSISILALALAVLAVILGQLYVHKMGAKRKSEDMVSVLVAAKDVPSGSWLRGTQVTTQLLPKQSLIPDVVLPKDMELILGLTTSHDLKKGQQILWTDIIAESKDAR